MCPPGVDQTTRTTQRWKLLVPRLQQVYDHDAESPYSRSHYPPLFKDHKSWDVWSKLARLPRSTRYVPPPQQSPTFSITSSSPIESIPPEILELVITSPPLSKSDIIAFGLASPVIWPHVVRHVSLDCRYSITSWAGAEIAYAGTWLTDIPPAFEKDSLFKSSVAPVSTFGRMCTARRLNYAAGREYKPAEAAPKAEWKKAFNEHCDARTGPCEMELLSAISPIPQAALKELWVLRNLVTNEYIRCRFDAETQRGFVETEVVRLALEDALMLRFCWTSCQADPPEGPFNNRGPWAGHAFDIVLAEEEMLAMVREGWKDSTPDIVDEAKLELRRLRHLENRDRRKDEDYHLARKGARSLSFNKELMKNYGMRPRLRSWVK